MKKFIGIVLIAITAGWNFSQSEKKNGIVGSSIS